MPQNKDTIRLTSKEIGDIAKKFTKGILGGKPTTDMCYIVCSPLVSFLNASGIECSLTEGELNDLYHHFWITLADGKIIDPTADQFGLLNIWCRKQPSYYRQYTPKDYNEQIETAVKKMNTNGPK